jgi:hypothetical protein
MGSPHRPSTPHDLRRGRVRRVVIVGFCVPVDDGVRVIGIRLVEMLRRQGVGGRQTRRERENQGCPPERPHRLVIMDEK